MGIRLSNFGKEEGSLKRTIAIIYGGFSDERVISEQSAAVVQKHLPSNKYDSYLVDIHQDHWSAKVGEEFIPINKNDFTFILGGSKVEFDAVFNAIHGTPGEDGKIQGYFDVLGIPYNNCGVLASSLTFNKAACNRYLSQSGVLVAESFLARIGETIEVAKILERVGLPCFVKPVEEGSSIGVTKVKDEAELEAAILKAQSVGVDALVERFLDGVEVSCGCITLDDKIEAIGVTEIVPANEFFDFDSKYHNTGTQEITPARIDEDMYGQVMQLTEEIYHWLHAKGMIRVDYMICGEDIFLIEVNTTPGLSEASIIPQQVLHHRMSLEEFFDKQLSSLF